MDETEKGTAKFRLNLGILQFRNKILKNKEKQTNLWHLWDRRDIRYSFEGRTYNGPISSAHPYDPETWHLRI